MEQVGYILSTRKEMARVEVKRLSGCSGTCKSCSGCDTPSIIVDIENRIGAKVGDLVEIRASGNTILKYTVLIYMIPLVMLVVGTGLGILQFKNLGYKNYELYGFFTGVISLVVSVLILALIDKKAKDKARNMMEIVRVLN